MTIKIILKEIYKKAIYSIDHIVIIGLDNNKNKSSVALIRMDAIGDFIIWLDSAKEYRKIYPNERIVLIANSAWAELAKNFNYWDEVLSVNIKSFSLNPIYRWQTLRKINKKRLALAIQPTVSRAYGVGDSVIRATQATERIGSIGDYANISIKDRVISDQWYTRLIEKTSSSVMELLENAHFLSELKGSKYYASLPKLPQFCTSSKYNLKNKSYLVIFPGASWHGKQWPASNFSKLAQEIVPEYNLKIIFCGSSRERELCDAIGKQSSLPYLNLAGKTSLLELSDVIRDARVLISNDTSATHIAVAVNTPVVCILGGGHYGRFLPYPEHLSAERLEFVTHKMNCFNCNWKCTQPHDPRSSVPCIRDITVQEVKKAVRKIVIQSIS